MEKDFIKNMLYMAVGYASIEKEKIEQFTKDLTEKGKLTEEEGKKMINELIQRSKEVKEDIEGKIENVSKEIYETLHLATKEEIEVLKQRISDLEAKFK